MDELEEMFHQSVDNYLEMCREFGKEPDKEFKGKFNVRIPPMLHRAAAYYAKKQEISLNDFVIAAIRDACEKMQMQA